MGVGPLIQKKMGSALLKKIPNMNSTNQKKSEFNQMIEHNKNSYK